MTEQRLEVKPEQQLEAEERRRSLVLMLLGLAAVAAFWLGVVYTPLAGAIPPFPPSGGGAGNVVFVGFNGSQSFWLWAPPGSIVRWEVAFCNVAGVNATVVVRVAEVPREIRRFLFYINGTRFGWDGVNNAEWRSGFTPNTCIPGILEIVVDGRTARDTIHLIKAEVVAWLSPR